MGLSTAGVVIRVLLSAGFLGFQCGTAWAVSGVGRLGFVRLGRALTSAMVPC